MFNDDLKQWKKAEREFASRLMRWDVVGIQFSQWEFPWRDIKATFNICGKLVERSYEVKEDRKAETTWNVWIEYMYKWNPSWIYTSCADIVVYKIWDKFYYADRLKFIIELSKIVKQDVVWWDDDNVQMWLVKRDVFNLLMTELWKN
jgi:hypothetical protein